MFGHVSDDYLQCLRQWMYRVKFKRKSSDAFFFLHAILNDYFELRKNLSVQETLGIFEELSSDDDSAASNNSGADDEDNVENVAQGENISSDDKEIDVIQ
ncbi:hypothetical protein TNIN_254961 [Trichonephila inaurata madagascariensis]|uniref:Uncharacterized protein n=1 Tax=Trichonephila inaurata madagascariensis TaxID=2747483 RepID=A0A8X6XSJ7_9ARAC|nr:hypothetical protein TNIN_254961 [Trichonephila inaurata madagascariensis]